MTTMFSAIFFTLLIGSSIGATPFINNYLDNASRQSLIKVFQTALNSQVSSCSYHVSSVCPQASSDMPFFNAVVQQLKYYAFD
ncbi:unnamed protein product [Anisakis simplex]|uniref:Secreted protein n=1 Tax=Anisakis simplex TaxID=6269 RepID=A0A0M3J4Y0_ANISI|nr:unnamed protein product [Anisakis simplex]